jgi:hypothetical protein
MIIDAGNKARENISIVFEHGSVPSCYFTKNDNFIPYLLPNHLMS